MPYGKIFFYFLCLLLICCVPFLGMTVISPTDILQTDKPDAAIFWHLRVPRVLVSFLAGAGLAISGMVFQAMFRNPLASPYTLGISSGAACGAALYFTFCVNTTFAGLFGGIGAALAGSVASMAMVYLCSLGRGDSSVMLLAGVIVNFFFSSLVMFIQYCANAHDSQQILRWLMGTVTGIAPIQLFDLSFLLFICTLFIWRLAPELDLLMINEEIAASRGVNVNKLKLSIFISASLLVASIVSLTGPIGFVGLMIPHICRMLFGWSHSSLLPVTFFLGGTFLVLCDLLARLIIAPAELPIGIITAMTGCPFFLWILFKNKRH